MNDNHVNLTFTLQFFSIASILLLLLCFPNLFLYILPHVVNFKNFKSTVTDDDACSSKKSRSLFKKTNIK